MLNSVIMMGRLVENPTTIKGEKEIEKFTLAVDNGKDNNTLFIDCVCFDNKSVSYLHKGDKIVISGRLQQRTFQTKEGSTRKVYEVIVNAIDFVNVKPVETKAE